MVAMEMEAKMDSAFLVSTTPRRKRITAARVHLVTAVLMAQLEPRRG